MYKICNQIGFATIVSSLKACRMPVINGLPFRKSVKTQNTVDFCFSASINKNGAAALVDYLFTFATDNHESALWEYCISGVAGLTFIKGCKCPVYQRCSRMQDRCEGCRVDC